MLRRLSALTGLLFLACASPGVVATALHGDLAALQRRIQETQQAGEMDRSTVEQLARAVAGRELRSSQGQTAVHRIRQVRACAAPLLPVLRERAQRLDEAGAEATMLLLRTDRLSAAPLLARYRDASDGAWRAVAARAAIRSEDAALRRTLMVDHDERVRRAALEAALDEPNPDDLPVVLEAARLDPDPLTRGLAARAAGAIGGERAAVSLRDYWSRADETTRLMIIEGWAMPPTYATGGREALIWVAETQGSLPAVAAGDALARQRGDAAHLGVAVLLRAMQEGTQQERRLALRLAPLSDADVRKELRAAAKDKDREVQVMALARLVAQPSERGKALPKLKKLAAGKDRIAIQARAALAAAGDASVVAQLRQQVSQGTSHRRRLAALGLLRLGRFSAAATALGDDDPAVRTAVACSVLTTDAGR